MATTSRRRSSTLSTTKFRSANMLGRPGRRLPGRRLLLRARAHALGCIECLSGHRLLGDRQVGPDRSRWHWHLHAVSGRGKRRRRDRRVRKDDGEKARAGWRGSMVSQQKLAWSSLWDSRSAREAVSKVARRRTRSCAAIVSTAGRCQPGRPGRRLPRQVRGRRGLRPERVPATVAEDSCRGRGGLKGRCWL